MLIQALRFVSDNDTTASIVAVDDKFECFGIEDEPRAHKIPSETRIPAGTYPVRVRTHGGFHNRYSEKFDFHQGMLEICNVPMFTDVLIHIGNDDDDTAGCLLVNAGVNTSGPIVGMSSTGAYKKLYSHVIQAALDGELHIQIEDGDL